MPENLDFMGFPMESEDMFSLAVVRSRQRVLLGRKSRGFAAGKMVLPGGKDTYYLSGVGSTLVPGAYGASREVFEETGLHVPAESFQGVGVLHVPDDGDRKTIWLHTAMTQDTVPRDTSELSDVHWHVETDLPYDHMPDDYRYWLPHVLDGFAVNAYLEVEDSKVVGGDVFRLRLYPLGRGEHLPVSVE